MPGTLFLPFAPFAGVGFTLFGALLVLVGASQDEIRTALGIDLAQAGLLVSAVVSGIGLGVLCAGPLVDRFPRRPLCCLAAGLTGIALLGLGTEQAASQGYWTVFAMLVLAGVGGGLYETIFNAAAIEHYPDSSVRMIAILHSGASIGAMATPVAIGWAVSHASGSDWTLAFRVTGAAHLGLAVASWGVPLGTPALSSRAGTRPRGGVLTKPLVLLCLAAFAYVGVESAITGLAIPYAEDALGLSADRGRTAISVFWLGLLAGRLVFAVRAGEVDDARIGSWMGGAAALLLGVGVALAWSAVEALFAIVGFSLGGVFPLLVALAGRRTPQAPATGVAVVAGLGSAGGFVAPWLTGSLGDAVGIQLAIASLALWCAAIAIASTLAERFRS